jgi:hypothetical protein
VRFFKAAASPNYCLNGHKFALSGWMDERKKVVSTSSTNRKAMAGWFLVDMEVDELEERQYSSRNQHWQRQAKCLWYNRKKVNAEKGRSDRGVQWKARP